MDGPHLFTRYHFWLIRHLTLVLKLCGILEPPGNFFENPHLSFTVCLLNQTFWAWKGISILFLNSHCFQCIAKLKNQFLEKYLSIYNTRGLKQGLRFYVSNKLPSDVAVIGPWTSHWTARSESTFTHTTSLKYYIKV